jgi:hypothetical protein
MAGSAIGRCVCTLQREFGGGMVKVNLLPAIHSMTGFTLHRIRSQLMLLCLVVLYLMARDAIAFGIAD